MKNILNRIRNYTKSFDILPRKFFIYAPQYLAYIEITKTFKLLIGCFIVCAFLIGFGLGSVTTSKQEMIVNLPVEVPFETKYDHAIGDIEWKDSIFNEYNEKAKLYLSQERFHGTPIKGDMLSLAARNAYDSTGILLPLELALSQAQWESGMGRHGRSPKNNPYNVGEYDSGTVKYFKNTFDGIQAYYYLMCNNYLACKSVNELFVNFTDCNGHRYASTPIYEKTIKRQYFYLKEWFKENYVAHDMLKVKTTFHHIPWKNYMPYSQEDTEKFINNIIVTE